LVASASMFGRLYAAMEGGVPVTRFLMQMFRTGAITADTRDKIISLAKEVKDGTTTMAEAWPQVTASITRVRGPTQLASHTCSGSQQLFTASSGRLLAAIGPAVLPVVTIVVQGATLVVRAVTEIIQVAKDVAGAILAPFAALGSVLYDNVLKPMTDGLPVVH